MEPPSYEDARFHPPALGTEAFNSPPPPGYDASILSPTTPPPTYGEAVTFQPDPFPVLIPPTLPTDVTSPPQNTGSTVHQITQIGVTPSSNGIQTQPAVVRTQPQPVPISVTHLRDAPGLVRCPHCQHLVTSDVTYEPGWAAWFICALLTLMGLVCGFCLIPLMSRRLQDAHHYCPRCRNQLHVSTR
ncbi:lipopolysaccharide-induced tumor necrosis factor-alpha factor homolog [Embiotoca jacksoni]|uniref:lipopolysaccharide-induced tumor necrosis factor-alpha factor homolog n=1 Tax=Embiotoca jacksoni TaxID=100190 RepID=UPI0037045D0D